MAFLCSISSWASAALSRLSVLGASQSQSGCAEIGTILMPRWKWDLGCPTGLAPLGSLIQAELLWKGSCSTREQHLNLHLPHHFPDSAVEFGPSVSAGDSSWPFVSRVPKLSWLPLLLLVWETFMGQHWLWWEVRQCSLELYMSLNSWLLLLRRYF